MTDRVRLPPLYRFIIAWGPYSKGTEIRPVGLYKDALLARKVIEPVAAAPAPAPEPELLLEEAAAPRRRREK